MPLSTIWSLFATSGEFPFLEEHALGKMPFHAESITVKNGRQGLIVPTKILNTGNVRL